MVAIFSFSFFFVFCCPPFTGAAANQPLFCKLPFHSNSEPTDRPTDRMTAERAHSSTAVPRSVASLRCLWCLLRSPR
uniref:Putative secreted protein n=1 Tax=Anopheles marajoara TaxID=58244 RepID=A0A2M4CCR6_9DIPT